MNEKEESPVQQLVSSTISLLTDSSLSPLRHSTTREQTVLEYKVDLLLKELCPDKNMRLTTRSPSANSKELLRTLIRSYVSLDRPIPVLIAVSACKLPLSPSNNKRHEAQRVDGAEVIFSQACLTDLQFRVKAIHAPGLQIVIRCEDLTLIALFPGKDQEYMSEITREYVKQLRELFRCLNTESFIEIRAESSLMERERFLSSVLECSALFEEYILATDKLRPSTASVTSNESSMSDDSITSSDEDDALARATGGRCAELLNALQSRGWQGGVSYAMRDWLQERYETLYTDLSEDSRRTLSCHYLACILVRRQMHGTGFRSEEVPFGRIEVSLVPPAPDTPKDCARLYYRSFPLTLTKTKAPFWRCTALTRQQAKTNMNNSSALTIAIEELSFNS